MQTFAGIQDWLNALLGLIAGAGVTFMTFRRKYSSDSKIIEEGRVETTLLQSIITERDAAMTKALTAWNQQAEDGKRIARFETLLEVAEKEMERLREEISALRVYIQNLTSIIVRLDPDAASFLHVQTIGTKVKTVEVGEKTTVTTTMKEGS